MKMQDLIYLPIKSLPSLPVSFPNPDWLSSLCDQEWKKPTNLALEKLQLVPHDHLVDNIFRLCLKLSPFFAVVVCPIAAFSFCH